MRRPTRLGWAVVNATACAPGSCAEVNSPDAGGLSGNLDRQPLRDFMPRESACPLRVDDRDFLPPFSLRGVGSATILAATWRASMRSAPSWVPFSATKRAATWRTSMRSAPSRVPDVADEHAISTLAGAASATKRAAKWRASIGLHPRGCLDPRNSVTANRPGFAVRRARSMMAVEYAATHVAAWGVGLAGCVGLRATRGGGVG